MLRIDRGSESLRMEMREMRDETRGLRAEMHSEFGALRSEISGIQRQMATIGWGIAAALLAQLIAFVITQS